jgi:mannose-6-phosphate isomerase-like protein (cupin superfamily)
MLIRLTAVMLLAAAPAWAQVTVRATPPDAFRYLPASEIDKAVSTPEPGRVYGASVVNDHENYYIEFVKRLDHGNAVEQHGHWVDQITVIAGEGVLTYGGTLTGGTVNGAEVRGGTQAGATTQALHPGDFVLIPAGMPHKFDAAPGKTLTYVVAKARQ